MTASRPDFTSTPGLWHIPAIVLALCGSAALTWWMVLPGNAFAEAPAVGSALSWILLAVAVVLLGKVPRRRLGAVVVVGAVLLGTVAVSAPPRTSNDSARYAWDGIVQKSGISPYSYVPVDEALKSLRPEWLFASGALGPEGKTTCEPDLFGTETVAASGLPSGDPLCTAVNRPHVPTIYPPTAELYFLLVRANVPDTVGFLPLQLGGLLISVAVTLMLLRVLAQRKLPLQLAAVWGWSPLVLLEAVNNAHVDVLGAALVLTSGILLAGGRAVSSGAAFGAAVAAKFIPVVAAPALLFRRPARFVAAALGTFVLLYIPYLALAGGGVLGFLPGYLKQEGYSQGGGIRFGLAQLVSAGPWPAVLSAAALAIVALSVLRRTNAGNLWNQQTLIMGLTLLIISPTYPWYALMLLPFIVLSRRWEYVAVILALDVIYMVPLPGAYSHSIQQGALLLAAATLATGARWRRRHDLELAAYAAVQADCPTLSPVAPGSPQMGSQTK